MKVRLLPRRLMAVAAQGMYAVDRRRGRRADVTPASLIFISRRASYPNERACVELGWSPAVSLAEGMRRTEEWLRAERII
jgi:nucleoside-diphosphate-sugar epimerase